MKRTLIWGGGIAAAVAIIVAVVLVGIGAKEPVAEGAMLTPISAKERDPAVFGQYYPAHYDSYRKNDQNLPAALKYGGADKADNLAKFPYMKVLWAGYGFSKEYNEDRGHTYTVEDVLEIKRINEKSIASCMYCKSAEVPDLLEKHGIEFFGTNFHELKGEMKHPISCSDCHDPTTMSLRISRPAFTEAMSRRGIDVSNATRQEMRTYVCAQCHVEYYFDPKTKAVTFPWDKGVEPEQIYAYYKEMGFSDWKNPVSENPSIKAQHPEFEMFQGSTHQANGLSCADCHMPYVREGNAKISSHWWTSPVRTLPQSCGTCHRQSEDELKQRILYTQDRVKDLLDRAGNANQAAIEAIAEANKAVKDQAKLDEAKTLQREAQFYWDYVAADNSMGFHNPQKAMSTLGKSIELAQQARILALEATR